MQSSANLPRANRTKRQMEHPYRDIDHDLSHIDPDAEQPPSKKRSPYSFIWIAAVLSLLVHLGLFFLSVFMPENPVAIEPPKSPMRTHLVRRTPQVAPQEKNKQVVKIAPPVEKENAPEKPDY